MNRIPCFHAGRLSTILFFGTFLLLVSGNQSSGQSCWTRDYDFNGTIDTIIPTSDGNFVSFGTIWNLQTDTNGWSYIFLMKIRPDGDTVWFKPIRLEKKECFHSATVLPSGEFIVVALSNHDDFADLVILKLTATGDIVLTRTYAGEFSANFSRRFHTFSLPDGNFLFEVDHLASELIPSSCRFIKINSSCDTIWTRAFEVPESFIYYHVFEPTPDGNYLLCGTMADRSGQNSKVRTIKISSDGRISWERQFPNFDYYSTLEPTTDGGALLAMSTINGSDITVVRIASNGTLLFDKQIKGPGDLFYPCDLMILPDGFVLRGAGDSFTFLKKLSMDGTPVWEKKYDLAVPLIDLCRGTNNGLLMGTMYENTLTLLKTDNCGDTVWTQTLGSENGLCFFSSFIDAGNGTVFLRGYIQPSDGSTHPFIRCLIDDRTASKNTPFTFKIPSLGSDTADIGIAALKVPAGMTVSAGGTISWTPSTDSSYCEHVAFVVVNDLGRKDTVSFNIAVNPVACSSSAISALQTGSTTPARRSPSLTATVQNGSVRFLLPAAAGYIDIYDMTGRRTGRVAPVATGSSATAVWPGSGGSKSAPGTYVAKTTIGGRALTAPFTLR